MIEINDLYQSYGETEVLKGITINIDEGEIYGLVGSSGAGKSTLLRCINGLVTYNDGSLKVSGIEVKNLKKDELREMRKNIGMIFQNFALIQRSNVYENIAMPMRCWNYSEKEINSRIDELLELIGLTDKKLSKPSELSGGQQQRVAIARAIAMEPKILLCDEVTSALDPNTSKTILKLLKQINEELDITVVVVTHEMEVVQRICDRMAILDKGVIVEKGETEDVFLSNSKILQSLTGNQLNELLPISGRNLKIFLRDGNESKPVLSDLAIDTDISYQFVWGGMDKYQDKILGSVIINVKESELNDVLNYLDNKKIECEVV